MTPDDRLRDGSRDGGMEERAHPGSPDPQAEERAHGGTAPTPEQRARIEAVFDAAFDLQPVERDRFIEAETAGDEELRREVLALLAASERSGVLDHDVAPLSRTLLESDPVLRIGPYRVDDVIGQGGMGVVYRGERDDGQFRRTVAIKVMRVGPERAELHRRLQAERQILASLDHPNIARLFDGGVLPDGRPYLVMEHIAGLPIDEYCDEHRLSVDERLELFRSVALAVHHAHRSLIVHRDLKPTNILVTAEGEPKLLDFGIAKVLEESPLEEQAPLTRTGLRLLTPEYASPEQVLGEQITTANDVYGLGIVLYELLTGRRPFDLSSCTAAEAERIIRWQDPPRPSTLLAAAESTAGAATGPEQAVAPSGEAWSPERAAAARRSSPQRLARRLQGDLDRIVLKALRKEPARRYDSAGQMAEDVARHLAGHPVLARGESIGYRARKFVSRHRWGVAAVSLVVVSLLGGLAATLTQAKRAERQAAVAEEQRQRAEAEAQKALRATAVMLDIFRLSDPSEALGDTITAREILDRGTERILREFEDQPELQADLLSGVARIYANLGLPAQAEPLVRRALVLRTQTAGPESAAVSESLGQLGQLLAGVGERDSAASVLQRAIAVRTATLPVPDSLLTVMQTDLAWQLRSMGQHVEAETLFEQALDTQLSLLGRESPLVASTMLGLASTRHDTGRFDEAEAMFRQVLLNSDAALREPHPLAATALVNIGMIRRLREQYIEAAPLLYSGLEMNRRLYGPDHPGVLEAATEYGSVLLNLGRYGEAEPVLRDVVDRAGTTIDLDHPTVRSARDGLAVIALLTGRYAESARLSDSSLATLRRLNGDSHPAVRFAWIRSAEPRLASGRLDDALARYAAAERIGSGAASIGVYDILIAGGRARIALMRNRLQRADSLLRFALAAAAAELRPEHRYVHELKRTLGSLRIAQGRYGEVPALLEPVLEQHDANLPDRHPLRAATLLVLADARLALGEPERTQPIAELALLNLTALPATHWMQGEAKSLLGASLAGQGRTDEGRALMEEGLRIIAAHAGADSREAERARSRITAAVPPRTAPRAG